MVFPSSLDSIDSHVEIPLPHPPHQSARQRHHSASSSHSTSTSTYNKEFQWHHDDTLSNNLNPNDNDDDIRGNGNIVAEHFPPPLSSHDGNDDISSNKSSFSQNHSNDHCSSIELSSSYGPHIVNFHDSLGNRSSLSPSLPTSSASALSPSLPLPTSSTLSIFSWIGAGLLISVGYTDCGNYVTDLAAGSTYGYSLLFVVLTSNLMAILLQYLSLKLGIAMNMDLAVAIRHHFPRWVSRLIWFTMEIAIIATDLAEVLGSSIALNILFSLPLSIGCLITTVDVFIILMIQNRSYRSIELIISLLVFFMFGCFCYELNASHPPWSQVFMGYLPSASIVLNSSELYIAISIVGATVMPHNLFLHSSIVLSRAYPRDVGGKTSAITYASIDSFLSLWLAFIINSAILIVSAAAFFRTENEGVSDLGSAYHLLSPSLGASAASVIFALTLLASGQNSTVSATMAGQIVMEGFLDIRVPQWVRRILTRGLAIIPALVATILYGEKGANNLLILSQVILSLTLSFATIPLMILTNNKSLMGEEFVNNKKTKVCGWVICFVILLLNSVLVCSPQTYQFS